MTEPVELHLTAYAGDDFEESIEVTLDGTPLDVSDWTFVAKIRRKRRGAMVAAFEASATGNIVTLSLAPEVTAQLKGEYVYDVEGRDGAARRTLVAGLISVREDVTR